MEAKYLLRKQVGAEIKIRRYVFYTLALLSLVYIGAAFLFSDTGMLRYLELRENRASLEKEINVIMDDTAMLKSSIEAMKENDFYLEKHAREDFGLAGPDEYIFIYK